MHMRHRLSGVSPLRSSTRRPPTVCEEKLVTVTEPMTLQGQEPTTAMRPPQLAAMALSKNLTNQQATLCGQRLQLPTPTQGTRLGQEPTTMPLMVVPPLRSSPSRRASLCALRRQGETSAGVDLDPELTMQRIPLALVARTLSRSSISRPPTV